MSEGSSNAQRGVHEYEFPSAWRLCLQAEWAQREARETRGRTQVPLDKANEIRKEPELLWDREIKTAIVGRDYLERTNLSTTGTELDVGALFFFFISFY